ncbi:integral membrane sensor signal transduction histidine kinase [Ruminiclostridium cellobioparum subsp. termitidis CT1112]|uniref:histidine kinase n=2 Tax=Ruminiclostridium cellobioparum TaxID=29355 RepID=S0FQ79_RUMCE|nr:integral membrane sensor signal transduction histidine kinase [Ruminiclostridium cellobioparum subsp. termitidis CT1112]
MTISVFIVIIPLLIVGGLSYIKSTSIIKERVSQSNFNTVKQIANNINFVFTDLQNSSVYLWQNKEFMGYLKLPENEVLNSENKLLSAQNSVNNFIVFKSNIYSIYVKGFNGLVFDSASAENTITGKQEGQLYALRGESMLISDMVKNYDNSRTAVISLLRLLKDLDDLSSNLAIIKLNISEEEISKIYQSKMLGTKGDYFIIDENETIISAMDKQKLGTKLDTKYNNPKMYSAQSGYFNSVIDKHNFLVTYINLSRPGWKLINLVPLDQLSDDTKIIRSITVYGVLISLALCLLLILFFSLKVLSPLKQIRRYMKYIENENFNVSINVKGNDEISLLGKSFNKMSKKLNELINEVYTVQIKQKEAELKALQAQINPHFLYNTLDTIYWMCRMENAVESSYLIQALSRLFRLSLNSGNEFTTVRHEIDHLDNYITIQEKRFEELIRFKINVSDEVLGCKVVKLVLQPLVENAIYHGIEKKGSQGTISVSVLREGNDVVYIIQDDGAGADEEELTKLLEKVEKNNRGFGIKNVNDRIKLYFGNEYGIKFSSSYENGTTVTVRQPFDLNG